MWGDRDMTGGFSPKTIKSLKTPSEFMSLIYTYVIILMDIIVAVTPTVLGLIKSDNQLSELAEWLRHTHIL